MFAARTAARSFALIAFSAIALAACGDDEPSGPSLPSAGTARVTIDVDGEDTTFTSEAIFGNDEGFGMLLTAEGPDAEMFLIFTRDSENPAVGNYVIDDITDETPATASEFEVFGAVFADGLAAEIGATSGTVRVTRSTATSFAGTFTMTADLCVDCESESPTFFEADIEGSFNASGASSPTVVQSRLTALRAKVAK